MIPESLLSPNLRKLMKQWLMRLALIIVAGPKLRTAVEWLTDVPTALNKARAENKIVLLDFTGSDWCIWCQRLEARGFRPTRICDFFAQDNLIMVEVDFPRNKPQSPEQIQANQALARTYNVRGYPTVVLIDSASHQVGRSGYQPRADRKITSPNWKRFPASNTAPAPSPPMPKPTPPPAPPPQPAFVPILRGGTHALWRTHLTKGHLRREEPAFRPHQQSNPGRRRPITKVKSPRRPRRNHLPRHLQRVRAHQHRRQRETRIETPPGIKPGGQTSPARPIFHPLHRWRKPPPPNILFPVNRFQPI